MTNKHIGLKLAKRLHSAGFEGESEKIWVLSKSAYDDKKPKGYITSSKQIKSFDFYKKTIYKKFVFGDMKTIAKCDYELVSEIYPAYTYQQILVDYAKELFGGEKGYIRIEIAPINKADYPTTNINTSKNYNIHAFQIVSMLQQNKPQEEIDDYISSNLAEKWQVKK